MVGTNTFVGHVNVEKDLNVVFQVGFRDRRCTPKLGVNTGGLLEVGGIFRK